MQVLHLFRKYILDYLYMNEVPTKGTFPTRIHIFHCLNIASYIPNSTFPKAHFTLRQGKAVQQMNMSTVYLQYHTNTRLKFLQCKGCCQDLSTWFNVICILYSTSQVFLITAKRPLLLALTDPHLHLPNTISLLWRFGRTY